MRLETFYIYLIPYFFKFTRTNYVAWCLGRWWSYSTRKDPLDVVGPRGLVGSRCEGHHRWCRGSQFVGVVRGSFGRRECHLGQTHRNPPEAQLRVATKKT